MRYIFRFLGVVIAWPILIFFVILGWLGYNFLLIMWYFNFEHLYWLTIKDYYFYIERDSQDFDLDKDLKFKWTKYSSYYITPLDMLKGKLTKIYT